VENELTQTYTQVLSLNKNIILTGDLNCDLLSENPRGDALRYFCASVNATQIIEKPVKVNEPSATPLDVVLVSNPRLVKSSG